MRAHTREEENVRCCHLAVESRKKGARAQKWSVRRSNLQTQSSARSAQSVHATEDRSSPVGHTVKLSQRAHLHLATEQSGHREVNAADHGRGHQRVRIVRKLDYPGQQSKSPSIQSRHPGGAIATHDGARAG